MTLGRWIGIGLVLAAIALASLWIDDSGAPTANGATPAWITAESCRECHADVWAEWESSYHAQAFTDPLVIAPEQADSFRKRECLPCHAPSPVFEHGIGKLGRVVERATARELGVDCLSCHRAHEHVIGPSPSSAASRSAPCRPVGLAELASPALCAPCHNQHTTVDEWEASSYAAAGITCLDCHMEPIERRSADGSTRIGRSHRFPGAHDLETLRRAFTLRWQVRDAEVGEPGRVLVVSITNSGAGHNFPADARHRALDLVVTLVQADGVEVPARDERPWGRERGTSRRRFRNPYREETERITNRELFGRENTQIVAGETVTHEVPFDPDAIDSARVELIYKLTPIQQDDEGELLHDERVQL